MRALGIDIYQRWQPNYVPQKHHTFVTIKVAEGQYVVQHERVWEQAKPIPINIAYLYLRSGVPALAQTEALIGATKNATHQPDGYMIDFERTNNSPSVQFGQIFKETVHIVSEETGKFVQKYSNPSIIQSWLLQYGQDWVLDEPETWVIAQYPFNRWAWRTAAALQFLQDVKEDDLWNPRLPAGFKGWGWWQYSADGNNQGPLNGIGKYVLGIGPAVDLQVFDGTHEEMLAVFDLGVPPDDDEECGCTEELDTMTEKYDAAVKSLSRRIRNNKNEIIALDGSLGMIAQELLKHTHEPPEPTHDVRIVDGKAVLQTDEHKNANGKPIWTDGSNIYEPRIRIEDGKEVWTIGELVTGDGGTNAYKVVGPPALNLPAVQLFVLERHLR